MLLGSDFFFIIFFYEGGDVDYDFVLFVVDICCDSFGEFDCCFYVWLVEEIQIFQCGFCLFIGLGNGEIDFLEGIFFDEIGVMANGYVVFMVVEFGQGFYFYINEFYGVGGEQFELDGFSIFFFGQVVDYFDCIVNFNCELQVVAFDQDMVFCFGNVLFIFNSEVIYVMGFEIYIWMGMIEALSYFDDFLSFVFQVVFLDNFFGMVEYIFEVSFDGCINLDIMILSIEFFLMIMVGFEAFFCEGMDLILDVGFDFVFYEWLIIVIDLVIVVDEFGIYIVIVIVLGNGCIIIWEVVVIEVFIFVFIIDGGFYLCEGIIDILIVQGSYDIYSWVGFLVDSFLVIDQFGNYLL